MSLCGYPRGLSFLPHSEDVSHHPTWGNLQITEVFRWKRRSRLNLLPTGDAPPLLGHSGREILDVHMWFHRQAHPCSGTLPLIHCSDLHRTWIGSGRATDIESSPSFHKRGNKAHGGEHAHRHPGIPVLRLQAHNQSSLAPCKNVIWTLRTGCFAHRLALPLTLRPV